MLRRLIPVFTLCLLTLPAFCQTTSKWQVATITEVKPHPAAGEDASDPITYDVSVKVGDTIYMVRYTTPAWRNRPEIRNWARAFGAGGKEHNYLQRHVGPVASGADRKPTDPLPNLSNRNRSCCLRESHA